jgi:hypothetical protein
VLVPVALVSGVAVPLVHVVDVVAVRHGVVPAVGVVLAVVRAVVDDVLTARLALVPMAVVLAVEVAVVQVVDVIVVVHLDVSALGTVLMAVLSVGLVLGRGHACLPGAGMRSPCSYPGVLSLHRRLRTRSDGA